MSFHSRGPITLNDLFANDSLFTLGISSFMYILFVDVIFETRQVVGIGEGSGRQGVP